MKTRNVNQSRNTFKYTSKNHLRRCELCFLFLLIVITVPFYILKQDSKNTSPTEFRIFKNLWRENSRTSRAPQHILLLTYARSGSTFVGELLQSIPHSAYYYEPAHALSPDFSNRSFDEAGILLDQLFTCQVPEVSAYTNWTKKNPLFVKHSIRYWNDCSAVNLCHNSSFLNAYCRKQSTVIVKTVRLTLREASLMFTTHPHLNLKIIYLIRDPRGSLNSRSHYPVTKWCNNQELCSNSKKYCEILADNLKFMCELSSMKPNDFTVIRYEDFTRNTTWMINHLVQFLGLSSTELSAMETFVKSHTFDQRNECQPGKPIQNSCAYNTFRNSSITALKWRQQLNFTQVLKYQKDCKRALDGLGYYSFSTISAIRSNKNFDSSLQDAVKKTCSGMKWNINLIWLPDYGDVVGVQ